MILFATSLIVNCAIVFPVASAMLADSAGMDAAFGPDSDARRILASVYLGIGICSLAGLAAMVIGPRDTVLAIIAALLLLQIVYKAITVAAVGLGSAVVLTNLGVVALHLATLALWFRGTSAQGRFALASWPQDGLPIERAADPGAVRRQNMRGCDMRSGPITALVAALLSGAASVPARAEVANGARFGDWGVACTAETTQRTRCALTQAVITTEGNVFLGELGLNLSRAEDGSASVLLILRTPAATLLPVNPALRVGEGDQVDLASRTCAGDFCTAVRVLDPSTVAEMRAGTDMVVGYQRVADAAPLNFRVSLSGVSAGLDALTAALPPKPNA